MNTPTNLPAIRIGAEVRPRVPGFTDERGIVTSQISKDLWGVTLIGDTTETDFTTDELTALS